MIRTFILSITFFPTLVWAQSSSCRFATSNVDPTGPDASVVGVVSVLPVVGKSSRWSDLTFYQRASFGEPENSYLLSAMISAENGPEGLILIQATCAERSTRFEIANAQISLIQPAHRALLIDTSGTLIDVEAGKRRSFKLTLSVAYAQSPLTAAVFSQSVSDETAR